MIHGCSTTMSQSLTDSQGNGCCYFVFTVHRQYSECKKWSAEAKKLQHVILHQFLSLCLCCKLGVGLFLTFPSMRGCMRLCMTIFGGGLVQWQRRWSHQQSCSASNLVNAGMGDHLWMGNSPWCLTGHQVNSVLHLSGVAKSITNFGWGKGRNVTSARWQVTLYGK